MTTFLPWILGRGQLQVRALTIAKCTHQRPFEIFDSSIDLESPMGKRIMEMSDSIIKAFNKDDDGYVDRTRQLYQSGGDQLFSAIDHGDNKDIGASVEAVLVSMLVLGWTAIEVCLEDLFAAVIAESKRAAALKGNDLRIVQMQCSSRSVAAPTKARSNVNKPKFATLQQAREAYARAFDVDSAQVDRALSSLQLDALALIRNLLVHRIGRTDGLFRQQSEGISSLKRFRSQTCKEVKINGDLTRRWITGVLRPVASLVCGADKWIRKYQ